MRRKVSRVSPTVTSRVITAQHHNQERGVGAVYWEYSDWTNFVCTCVCVRVCSSVQFYHICRFG